MATSLKNASKALHGTCPTCGAKTNFHFLGVQTWPQAVADKMGVPTEQKIWRCLACDTTLMEGSITPDNC